MKHLSASPKRVFLSNDDSPFAYYAWPSITRLPDGTLALATSGLRLEHVCPFGKAVISYSRDEGKTWTLPAIAIDTPLDDRDAGLTVFGNGRVMLTSFNNTTTFQRNTNARRRERCSDEAGQAYCDLIDAYLNYVDATGKQEAYLGSNYRISEDGGYTFGKLHHMPVTAPHGPCCLDDGSILYVGRRFSKDDSFDDGSKPYIECWKLDENDEPVYLSSIENVYDGETLLLNCEPHTIQLPDGTIIVHIRVQGGNETRFFTIYQSESHDGGRTFTRPHRLLDIQGGAPAHLMLHSSGALISVYGYRCEPYGIRAMISRDNGQSWDTDYILDDECLNGDLGYPATVELADHSLLTIYYENPHGISHIVGKTWTLPN